MKVSRVLHIVIVKLNKWWLNYLDTKVFFIYRRDAQPL